MGRVVTVAQMKALEKAAVGQGLTHEMMMDNAGRAVASYLENVGASGKRILILVGPGNNGGDGLVAASYLAQAGADVSVYCWGRDVAEDDHWRRADKASVTLLRHEEQSGLGKLRRLTRRSDWVVDALLGTGVTRPIAGDLKRILGAVAREVEKARAEAAERLLQPLRPLQSPGQARPRILAVDVPTGVNCDSGEADPSVLPADVTIAFGYPKVGQFRFPAAELSGELYVADIGLPAGLAGDVHLEVPTPEEVAGLLPRRPLDAHKGTFGRALVVAGSANYTGAAYLAAGSALRAGAGLVTLGIAGSLQPMIAPCLAEATYLLLPHELGALVPEAARTLGPELKQYSALLVGPGLGRDDKTRQFVAHLLGACPAESQARLGFVRASPHTDKAAAELPSLVVDADGLNALADLDGWAGYLPEGAVLTPHPGEMGRLLGLDADEVQADRVGVARRACENWGAVVVLKGAYTVISEPGGQTSINPFANPALATAGTGDVLAGTIVGLLAQGLAPFDAAVVGTYIHGLAGELAAHDLGLSGVLASDVMNRIPLAVARLGGVTDRLGAKKGRSGECQ